MKLASSFFMLQLLTFVLSDEITPCNLRLYKNGFVCVCNETYCDTIGNVQLTDNKGFVLISSSKGGLRFNVIKGNLADGQSKPVIVKDLHDTNKHQETTPTVHINIDDSKYFQEILGFGGALTGSASYNLDLMSFPIQEYIIRSYYSSDFGINYKMMRLTIGGCDFDLTKWVYNERPINDTTLSSFTKLNSVDLRRVSQIKRIKELTNLDDLKIIGAAWSSPTWMKSNNDWYGKSFLLPEYYQLWSEYYLRWLTLMNDSNVSIWGISTGNEPTNTMYDFIKFLNLGWTAAAQGKWIGEHFGPLLKQSKFRNVLLLGLDDERMCLPWWLGQMNAGHPNSIDYLDGILVHWYMDLLVPPSYLDETHSLFPNKFIFNSESTIIGTPHLGSWTNAENYIERMIQDFQNWITGWMDWNLMLDELGGPNYANNTCEAAIIVNTTSKNEFYKQPEYYALGHFSKFFVPNSIRIYSYSSNTKLISTVAFLRPDKTIAILIYNRSSKNVKIIIKDVFEEKVKLLIPSKSVHTLVISSTSSFSISSYNSSRSTPDSNANEIENTIASVNLSSSFSDSGLANLSSFDSQLSINLNVSSSKSKLGSKEAALTPALPKKDLKSLSKSSRASVNFPSFYTSSVDPI